MTLANARRDEPLPLARRKAQSQKAFAPELLSPIFLVIISQYDCLGDYASSHILPAPASPAGHLRGFAVAERRR